MSSMSYCRYLLIRQILRAKSTYVRRYKILPLLGSGSSGLENQVRYRSNSSGRDRDLSSIIYPVPVKSSNNIDDIDVGAELSGGLIGKAELLKLLNKFAKRPVILTLAAENGLDRKLFQQAFISFRLFCSDSEQLPVDLHIVLSDIIQNAGHIDDIFPYFLKHAKEMFPHIDCMEDLEKISDLRLPANWYPEARSTQRKIIFHAGPTNSGKTYHALQRFLTAKSGIYCGPLKLLAAEVFRKSNDSGTPCDLVTGEEKRYSSKDDSPSSHVSCTVEMANTKNPFEVAIIDEIQMIKDTQRGWAWTRALLGINAQEIHLCGEGTTIDLVKDLMSVTGDEVQVQKYKRLTSLVFSNTAVERFDNIVAGDCVVCFSKNDIFQVSRQLELRGKEVAVIYGGLPPGTKLAQAEKFNDPNDPCKIMVATDAIGMGLNLSIKRIIFYSMIKPFLNEKGEREMDVISTSQALQIGGRAGRYGTVYEKGEVTTFRSEDIKILRDVKNKLIEPIEQAGLHPTAEQLELFAYHLPNASLSNLMDIFVTICKLDSDKYFMCNVDGFKFLADMIEHVPLHLRIRYVFCCAPISKKQPFVCTMFLKFSRQFSRNEALTLDWLCRQIGWPFSPPGVIADLVHLEGVFDVLDLYLWLSYRFQDMFPDVAHVRDMQTELDLIIQKGVRHITQLLKAGQSSISTGVQDNEDDFEISIKDNNKQKMTRKQEKKKRREDKFKTLQQSIKHVLSQSGDKNECREKFGQITDNLIKEGIITHDMVRDILKESTKNFENDDKTDEGGEDSEK